jgi:hypothetical protein
MAKPSCGTLGGSPFDPVRATASVKNVGSTNNVGRHGASNLWSQWPKSSQNSKGISGRAPYDQGGLKRAPSIGGNTTHTKGAGLGPHGHGIGVVKAHIGGPHNRPTNPAVISRINSGNQGIKTLQPGPAPFCGKCFTTWATIGFVFLVLLVFTGK